MAIVYSYPKVTSPLATDVLVLTDTTVTAGKRKNKTKSIAMSDVATYVINSKSGVTGSGTTNYIAKWNTSSSIQDSNIFDNGTNVGIGTSTPLAKLHVNSQNALLVTDGNETGLEINNGSYIYKIGDISGGENQSYMQIDSTDAKAFFLNSNVGIGTSSPASKLTVTGGDAEVTGSDKGLILESPNGTRYRIKVDNSGNLTTTSI